MAQQTFFRFTLCSRFISSGTAKRRVGRVHLHQPGSPLLSFSAFPWRREYLVQGSTQYLLGQGWDSGKKFSLQSAGHLLDSEWRHRMIHENKFFTKIYTGSNPSMDEKFCNLTQKLYQVSELIVAHTYQKTWKQWRQGTFRPSWCGS